MADVDVSFRPLRRSDFPLLVEWFAQEHIARWWNEPATLESVAAKYGRPIDGLEPTSMWIIEVDGQAAGLAQSYRNADYPQHDAAIGVPDAAGIDYLLSKPYVGRGIGTIAVRELGTHVLRLYPDAACVVATPAQANEASWRALERAGFERRGECQPPDEPPAFAYVLHRAILRA
jgi:RimJ/RimL family protein N-acetyltransferase